MYVVRHELHTETLNIYLTAQRNTFDLVTPSSCMTVLIDADEHAICGLHLPW